MPLKPVIDQEKAESVEQDGSPDGFVPPSFYEAEVLSGGVTRLKISLPTHQLEAVHRALTEALQSPLKIRYLQFTDRQHTGQLPKPINWIGVDKTHEEVLHGLEQCRGLVYHDGRHQLWIRGHAEEQLVLEEIGIMYLYPDDPSFRDILEKHGVAEGTGQTIAERDYVKVNFAATFDEEEERLISEWGLIQWGG